MRLIFMGTPEFAAHALRALHEAGHDILCVYSQPPRPAGRGYDVKISPVQALAQNLGLAVRTPASLKADDAQHHFASLGADAAIVVAYGLMLPKPVLEAPRFGCFNIHASLLPRWRGAAPIQRAIMAGDVETGISIMRMDEGLDTGPVLKQVTCPITDETTAGTLHDTLAVLGAAAMLDVLAKPGQAGQPQAACGITYAQKISKGEAHIDFSRPARAVLRHIHGLSPFPGAWCEVKGVRLKILHCAMVVGTGPAGTALDDGLAIACGEGAIRALKLQREGKGPLDAETFLRGFPIPAGTQVR